MEEELGKNNEIQEAGEEQLNEHIKLAGKEARSRRKEALARHVKMREAAVAEGVARRKIKTKNPV